MQKLAIQLKGDPASIGKPLSDKHYKERENRKNYTDVLIDLPISSDHLPEWVKQHRQYKDNFNEWRNTLAN